MSKAFDKVNHKILVHKLRKFGFGGPLLQWFNSYLTDRLQRVTVPGATSNAFTITSGVPQGSILGPALFLLYVNDLLQAVESSRLTIFADDLKVYKEIRTPADSAKLQVDLNALTTQLSASALIFNGTKRKSQSITRL